MKRQTSVRLSDGTRNKLDRLVSRYGTATEAIAVAVDRLYAREEARMQYANYVRHVIDTDGAALFGDDPGGDIDLEASARRLQEMIEVALKAAFPDHEIDVQAQPGGGLGWVITDGQPDDNGDGQRYSVAQDVWSGWEWLVNR